ncbi:MAG: serine hydrolase, partial [Acidobacteria bacterium]|nr:serine hydrolase [Acidobacteriota bacterium]
MRKLLIASRFVLIAALLFGTHLPSTRALANTAGTMAPERLDGDTPKTTVLGNTFIAPKQWSISVKGPATVLEAPEGDSWIALVDVQAQTPEDALAAAWQAYKPKAKWPIKVTHDLPDKDGWTRRHAYEYLTSPNEKRGVFALVYYSGSSWTVVIEDLADAVAEKRGGQESLVLERLLPKGYTRESFAGKKANALDRGRIEELGRFIEKGQKETGVPG